MDDVLDLGEVAIPDWADDMKPREYIPFRELMNSHGPRKAFMMHDIKFVRASIRKRRYGETEPVSGYRVSLVWPNGETAAWEFDLTVGWPIEDGKRRNWRKEWVELFEGVA
ncbi:hypothetical protein SEA_DEJAVU_93 [Microbacterium Phage DejaVu]|nr:hypothetical protein LUPINE_92 [Microbacterium phage Lupine]QDH92239.1 hypothetical protein SEA_PHILLYPHILLY_90 [Microbacterium phage PhillyPhilly]QDK03335.1 hypothetical protein SEA_ROMAN_94 [Microbacterium phage Roman]QIG58636.1 hypothetical protein SEA_HUBBS_91 [Microbacterium phage Hubbs]UVG34148.1 hypothetical protein SEA_PAVLO_92 [Microbacterium phage Pavlo]WNM66225.1 hypothetical protein SEA_DEJAVU_93 [Microbacterium Phage DejaVu]